MATDRVYTLSEVSKASGISTAALTKRILRGKLQASKNVSGRWVIDERAFRLLCAGIRPESVVDGAMERVLSDDDSKLSGVDDIEALRRRLERKRAEHRRLEAELADVSEAESLLEQLIEARILLARRDAANHQADESGR